MPQSVYRITTDAGIYNVTVDDGGEASPLPPEATRGMRPNSTAADQPPASTIGDMASDAVRGLRSSAARTVYGGGDLIRRATGMERVVDRPDVKAAMTAPDSTTGRVASLGGDVGQFFLPTGLVGKVGKAAEIAKAGALTLAQTGDPLSAGVSSALTGVLPGAAAATRAVGALKGSAEKSVAQALGATKEWAKDTASKLARPMLDRGVKGSRESMLAQAAAHTADVGKAIGAEIQAAAQAGETISGNAIRGVLANSKVGLMVPDAAGRMIPIEGTQRVLRKLDRLESFVAQLGDDIPIDKAATIKTTYDRIVSRAGMYGQKAGASATDSADAWAVREAAGAFRDLLAKGSPTLADLNQEYAFWKGLKGVLTETQRRTQAQGGGLISAGMGGSGAVVGALTGEGAADKAEKAVLYGLAGRQIIKLAQSPAFRTSVSAPLKDTLASALASGHTGPILHAISKITASMPGQLATTAGATR